MDESSVTAAHIAQPDSIMQKVLVALMLSGAACLAPQSVAPKTMARRQLGSAFLGGAALVATTASAYEGVYSMEIVKAKDVVLDEEALRSGAVQSALGEFKNYAVGIVRLREALAKDDQFDTSKVLKKDYDYVKVRATFNTVWKSNFRRPTPSTRSYHMNASARWRGGSTPSTRRCPHSCVCSMAWRFTKVSRNFSG